MKLKVIISTAAIADKLNEQFEGKLYEAEARADNDYLQIGVFKNGMIGVEAVENHLLVSVPVHVKARSRRREPLMLDLLRDLSGLEKTRFNITVYFRLSFRVGLGWELEVASEGDFVWERRPRVGIGLMKIPITRLVEPVLRERIIALNEVIESRVRAQIPLRTYVEMAWQAALEPIRLNEDLPAWWQLHPQTDRVLLDEVRYERDRLSVMIEAPAGGQVYARSQANPAPDQKLPEPMGRKGIGASFSLPLRIELPFECLRRYVATGDFMPGGNKHELRLKEIQLAADRVHLLIQLRVEGRFSGWGRRQPFSLQVDLRAEPYCDPDTGRVKVRQARLTPLQGSWWLRSWLRIRKHHINHQLEQHANRLLLAQQEELLESARASLRYLEINPDLHLEGNIREIDLQEIRLDETGLLLTGEARASLALHIKGL